MDTDVNGSLFGVDVSSLVLYAFGVCLLAFGLKFQKAKDKTKHQFFLSFFCHDHMLLVKF